MIAYQIPQEKLESWNRRVTAYKAAAVNFFTSVFGKEPQGIDFSGRPAFFYADPETRKAILEKWPNDVAEEDGGKYMVLVQTDDKGLLAKWKALNIPPASELAYWDAVLGVPEKTSAMNCRFMEFEGNRYVTHVIGFNLPKEFQKYKILAIPEVK